MSAKLDFPPLPEVPPLDGIDRNWDLQLRALVLAYFILGNEYPRLCAEGDAVGKRHNPRKAANHLGALNAAVETMNWIAENRVEFEALIGRSAREDAAQKMPPRAIRGAA